MRFILRITDDIHGIKGIGSKRKTALSRLGLATVYDLLTYFPRAYEDQSSITPLAKLIPDTKATVIGVIHSVQEKQTYRRRGFNVLTALITDDTGFLQLTWFNQRYLKPKLRVGERVMATGKLTYAYGGQGQLAMSSPSSFELLGKDDAVENRLGIEPIYALTANIKQKFLRQVVANALAAVADSDDLAEILPANILTGYQLIGRIEAFRQIHFPKNESELKAARRRLAFEELYLIQCGLLLLKRQSSLEQKGIRHLMNSKLLMRVWERLPFTLTSDQQAVWEDIVRDMEFALPMRRLIQGDVGSGKTVLAMLALVKTVENGYQGALMAPTEILASQHYHYLCDMLETLGVRIGLLSGRLTKKKRADMDRMIALHEVDIVVGTHALLEEHVQFAKLGLVVTDEQHRFGINQRAALEKKADAGSQSMPDVLVMTATPIPRTMTLTVYGDLDVSRIEHLPPGRKPVRTFIRQEDRRGLIYEFVRKEIAAGRQAYVVCPLIKMNEELELPSAEEVYEELSSGIFRDVPCALMHGKLKSSEKDDIMQAFYENKIKLLVSTTVIEVGVNVPNASILVVEHAERFGLAQLHQLRGRIGRGEYQSYCILIAGGNSEKSHERMRVIESTSDGFKLAEEDLRLRGPGQFFGNMQHGLGDLKIANVLADMDLLLLARRAAQETLGDKDSLDFIMPTLARQYRERFLKIVAV